MNVLELDRVTKCYGRHRALDDVTLQVKEGECLVVLGPSGAGKSTLLRVVAGLETVDSGQINIQAPSAEPGAMVPGQVSMLGQEASLYPQLSVRKNVAASLQRLSLTKSEVQRRVDSILEKFSIEDLAERVPSEISGGERQRVAFARALVCDPRILLLDEPLSHLDVINQERVFKLLAWIRNEFAPSILLISHSPWDAMRVADRIALLDRGRLLDVGSAAELYSNPKTRLAGQLVSPHGMNWIESRLVDWKSRGRTPEAAYLGFHAEHAQIMTTDDGRADSQFCLAGTVTGWTSMGHRTRVELNCQSANVVAVVDGADPFSSVVTGDEVLLCVDWQQIHWAAH